MTNPTMPASDELSERMAALLGSTSWEKQPSVVAEQIRQAEQAALDQAKARYLALSDENERAIRADERRKTLEEAAQLAHKHSRDSGRFIAALLLALSDKPSEPGEAA